MWLLLSPSTKTNVTVTGDGAGGGGGGTRTSNRTEKGTQKSDVGPAHSAMAGLSIVK